MCSEMAPEVRAVKQMITRQDGEHNNRAILTWDIVERIRNDFLVEPDTPAIAARYKISRPHVCNIVAGRRWIIPRKK